MIFTASCLASMNSLILKKHPHPSDNEECISLCHESVLVNNYLAIISCFLFRLHLTSVPASPAKIILFNTLSSQ